MKLKVDRIISLALVILCFASVIVGFISPNALKKEKESTQTFNLSSLTSSSIIKPDIAVLDISGIIMYGKESQFRSDYADANYIVRQLDKIEEDGAKSILIRINSPGGTASASNAIYKKLMEIRKKGNIKIYTVMQDVAASGGYYIASASNKIYADGSTMTGSIGVIMSLSNFEGLGQKVGVTSVVIKSGKFKDIGSATRKMTNDEKVILQSLIDDTYGQFVNAVSEGRNLDKDVVKKLGDGRIYTGHQAYNNKLIDAIGTQSDVIADIVKTLNLKDKPKLKQYTKPTWERLFEDYSAKSNVLTNVLERPEISMKFNKIPLMLYL